MKQFLKENWLLLLTLGILVGFHVLLIPLANANSEVNSARLPIIGYTKSSFITKFEIEDRLCVLVENQDGKGPTSLQCWAKTIK